MAFKGRRDLPMLSINIATVIGLIVMFFVMYGWRDASLLIPPLLTGYALLVLWIITLFLRLLFVVEDEYLEVQIGLQTYTFDYKNMKSIQETKGLYRVPHYNFMYAFSGFMVDFHDGSMNIRVSPENEREFITELFKKAPHLSYCSIEEYRSLQRRKEEVAQQEVISVSHLGNTVKGDEVGSSSSKWVKL
ncbi:PH domain-containing protein [Alkalihalophilus marmarensis]|uniref:Uncharacterized protein YyaB-like PH domain-containing protein n=1 Tax=Alkalihalophilus marmarensis DSM 21297 TaxID=1188261 RepID=U6SU82_9BACI|nr:PH domain-containing protein [Alkalihalophilus marmarensis]ERN54912.1 hypothetical protein A33I_04355 [Alkalihalophilus marmarensis DSM 21297]